MIWITWQARIDKETEYRLNYTYHVKLDRTASANNHGVSCQQHTSESIQIRQLQHPPPPFPAVYMQTAPTPCSGQSRRVLISRGSMFRQPCLVTVLSASAYIPRTNGGPARSRAPAITLFCGAGLCLSAESSSLAPLRPGETLVAAVVSRNTWAPPSVFCWPPGMLQL